MENSVEVDDNDIFFELLKMKPLSDVLSLIAFKSEDKKDKGK